MMTVHTKKGVVLMMLMMYAMLVAPVTLILLAIEVIKLDKGKEWALYIPVVVFVLSLLFSQTMAVNQPDNDSAGFFQIRCIIDFVCSNRYRAYGSVSFRYFLMLNISTVILAIPVLIRLTKTKVLPWLKKRKETQKIQSSGQ